MRILLLKNSTAFSINFIRKANSPISIKGFTQSFEVSKVSFQVINLVMMILKPLTCIFLSLISLLATFLFVGIKHDPEFTWEITTFIKYKPTFQLHFYDRSYGDLHNEETEKETQLYQDFVNNHHVWDFSFLIFQLVLSLSVIGFAGFFQNKLIKLKNVVIHFLICLVPCITALAIIFFHYEGFWFWLILFCLALINISTAIIILRRNPSNAVPSAQVCDATEAL